MRARDLRIGHRFEIRKRLTLDRKREAIMQLRRTLMLVWVIVAITVACSGTKGPPEGQLLATLDASIDQEVTVKAMTTVKIQSQDGALQLCAFNDPGNFEPPWGFWAIAKTDEVASGKVYTVSGTLRKGAPELEGFGASPKEGSYFIENAVLVPAAE
jgi:hypothetical protein